MYVCPACKGDLKCDRCVRCALEIARTDGIPSFFTGSPLSERYSEIARFYDDLYVARVDPWKDLAGREASFLRYVADLVEATAPTRYLDLGCGQGFLLGGVAAPEKFGIDLSRKALESARSRAAAELAQGAVEELPYPSGYFDVVTSMGAMEHFIDDLSAMREIHRVLRTGGRYIVEMFMRTPLTERIRIKTSEFLYPRFRPRELARWALRRYGPHEAGRPGAEAPPDDVDQPVMNFYTSRSARGVFERAGFRLARLITKRTVPNAPLPGHHYRIYVLEK